MNTIRTRRGRASERGEGTAKLIFFLGALAFAGYLAVQNVPTYFSVQNCKHDLAELARGTGVVKMPADRVSRQAVQIMNDHAIDPAGVKCENTPDGGIKITLNTTKQLDFVFTSYDWHVSEVFTQSPF